DQLEKKWFSSCRKVGISAGASTPSWVIDEVVAEIKGFGEELNVLHTSSGCESSL
ncbi:MAG: hypothetical protein ACD_15C00051G0001, partial [uncultured bacterium]